MWRRHAYTGAHQAPTVSEISMAYLTVKVKIVSKIERVSRRCVVISPIPKTGTPYLIIHVLQQGSRYSPSSPVAESKLDRSLAEAYNEHPASEFGISQIIAHSWPVTHHSFTTCNDMFVAWEMIYENESVISLKKPYPSILPTPQPTPASRSAITARLNEIAPSHSFCSGLKIVFSSEPNYFSQICFDPLRKQTALTSKI